MNLSKAFARVVIGAHAVPTDRSRLTAGSIFIGTDVTTPLPADGKIYSRRIRFGAADQTATFNFGDGTLAASTAGVLQVEDLSLSGALTASGNLTVTVTGAGVTGSPLAITVPVQKALHGSLLALAAAIAAKLNATAAYAALWEASVVTGAATYVRSTRKFPAANDATFATALTTALGVSGVSNNSVTGVAGVVVEAVAGSEEDVFGNPIDVSENLLAIYAAVTADSPESASGGFMGQVHPGATRSWQRPSSLLTADEVWTADGACILDLIYAAA